MSFHYLLKYFYWFWKPSTFLWVGELKVISVDISVILETNREYVSIVLKCVSHVWFSKWEGCICECDAKKGYCYARLLISQALALSLVWNLHAPLPTSIAAEHLGLCCWNTYAITTTKPWSLSWIWRYHRFHALWNSKKDTMLNVCHNAFILFQFHCASDML